MGILGPNGAGKTTLLKMVAGTLPPDDGSVRIGPSVTMGYFAQQALEVLDPQVTLLEQLQRDFPLETQPTLRKLLGAFQFPGDVSVIKNQWMQVSDSGMEYICNSKSGV